MNDIQKIVVNMPPEEALAAIAKAAKMLFPHVGEETKQDFVIQLIGDEGDSKVGNLVHLWLAECMDEGVDPTQMCQSLVDKVAQSKQLSAVTDPEILPLFEDWFEELENEAVSYIQVKNIIDPVDLAEGIGLSRSGADFIFAKLRREGKV